jgi:hypothetical protein
MGLIYLTLPYLTLPTSSNSCGSSGGSSSNNIGCDDGSGGNIAVEQIKEVRDLYSMSSAFPGHLLYILFRI